MKLPIRVLFAVLLASYPAVAQDIATGAFDTPIKTPMLHGETFCQWVAGRQTPVPEGQAKNGPRDIVWTKEGRPEWRGIEFGDGRSPGVRHLRIGLTEAVPIGSVLVRGGGMSSDDGRSSSFRAWPAKSGSDNGNAENNYRRNSSQTPWANWTGLMGMVGGPLSVVRGWLKLGSIGCKETSIICFVRDECLGDGAMSLEVEATYENGVLKLDGPLPFEENERIVVTVKPKVSRIRRERRFSRRYATCSDSCD